MEISFLIPVLVTCSGIYLLFKLKAFFILHPIKTIKDFVMELKNRESRRSLCLALAGTLGVGNIFGVSAGIMIGGEGSIFWLIISSFFAMVIKYAEASTVCSQDEDERGMSGVLEKGFLKRGRVMAVIYALFTMVLAFFMGATLQAGAITDVAESALRLNPFISIFILLIFFLPCLFGGVGKIEKVTEILIPMTTIIYIIMCISVILLNFSSLPSVIYRIISSAFSLKSWVGGMGAVAVKEGP